MKKRKKGTDQFVYNAMKEEIKKIECTMEEVVKIYGQRLRARAVQPGDRMAKECGELS